MSSRLHTETTGRGSDLFLIHGWALHGGVWDSLVPELARDWRVTRVDLPGHGRSRAVRMPASLTELTRLVAQAAPENAVWLGWSLGGLVAMCAALDFQERLRALILVSSTPRFVTAADWRSAMTPEQLEDFTAELADDYRGTVQRFLALQVQGDEHARHGWRRLRANLTAGGEPDAPSLAAGLEILRTSDLRTALPRLELPTLVMSGGYDRLTPPQAGTWLAAAIPAAHLHCFPKAAHALFLSHADEFIAVLQEFLCGLGDKSTLSPCGVPGRG